MENRPEFFSKAKTLPAFDPNTAEFGHFYLWPEMSGGLRAVLLSLTERNDYGVKAAISVIYDDGSMESRASRYFLADATGEYREPAYVRLLPETAHEAEGVVDECRRVTAFMASIAKS